MASHPKSLLSPSRSRSSTKLRYHCSRAACLWFFLILAVLFSGVTIYCLLPSVTLTKSPNHSAPEHYESLLSTQPPPVHHPLTTDGLMANYSENNPDCKGKELYLKILLAAKDSKHRKHAHLLCSQLPTQEEVIARYGPRPVIVGMETCQAYRDLLRPENNNGTQLEPLPRVAGLYHTGTNALARYLSYNVKYLKRVHWAFDPYDVPVS